MNYNIKIAFLGGDLRQLVAASELAEEGFESAVWGFDLCTPQSYKGAVRCQSARDAMQNASTVVLPVPVSSDGYRLHTPLSREEMPIDALSSSVGKGQFVLGGVISDRLIEKFESVGVSIEDYMKDEELTVKNAIPTAEGALYSAMREMNITIFNSQTVIFGYGRVGKATARLFKGANSHVTVIARRNDALANIEAAGYIPGHINDAGEICKSADLLINTVPDRIITPAIIKGLKKEAVIIDLASAPGGVDRDYASLCGIKTVAELSLPGRMAPVTAGLYIKDAILAAMRKRGII